MKVKQLVVVALIVPLALVAAGCGDDGSSSTGASGQETTTTAAEKDPTAGKTMGTPPKGDTADYNIAQIAAGTPQTQVLTRLVIQAGLVPVVRDGGPFTVFAPADDAFNAIPASTLNSVAQDIPQLTTVLTQHVVPGTYTTKDLKAANGTSLTTAAGSKLLVEVKGSDIYVGGAKIIAPDIAAKNGEIQLIDSVILEPNG